MVTLAEASGAKSQLGADLAAGLSVLSLDQKVVFTKYIRLVLPLDGFVFWVKADLVSPSAALNAGRLNQTLLDANSHIITAASTVTASGSLHFGTEKTQDEDATIGVNQVIFTSLVAVQDFNQIGNNVLFIATLAGGTKFAFSQRAPFYRQADLHHYIGTAVLPMMRSQIIDNVSQFDAVDVVVSNSLPIWLSLNGYSPPYPGFKNLSLLLYPSYAVPDNLPPPYGVVHIEPEGTTAIQAFANFLSDKSRMQLVRDEVRITLYGVRNNAALTFLDTVNQFSGDTSYIGMMNMPAVKDEKRPQVELSILAMKKTIDFEVSYFQSTSRNVARQVILSAIPSYSLTAFVGV